MMTLTKQELIEMVYRPNGELPEKLAAHIAKTDNTTLAEISSKSMRIQVQYIGGGVFMMKY